MNYRSLVFALAAASAGSLAAQDFFGSNLIVNGDAEAGPAGSGSAVAASIPGWTASGSANVVSYASGYSLSEKGLAPVNRGQNYFAGGPNNAVSTLTQTIDLSPGSAAIDGGGVTYDVAAYLGGASKDNAQMGVAFLDGAGNPLLTVMLGPVTADDRRNDGLYLRRSVGPLPAGARQAAVTLQMNRSSGSENDGFADSLSLVLHAAAAPESLLGTNLIVNGDAEGAPASEAGTVTPDIPGWVRSPNFSVDFYNDGGGDLSPTSPGPDDRGDNYFWGGTSNEKSSALQDIDVSSAASLIDQGIVNYTLSAWIGGYSSQDDNMTVSAEFQDWSGNVLGTSVLGPNFSADRNGNSSLLAASDSSTVPTGTRMVRVRMSSARTEGSDNDGLADNLALVFSIPQ